MDAAPAIRRATVEDAAELARLLSALGYPLTAADILAVWKPWEAEGNFALVAPGDGGLLGTITLHRMHVLHRPKPVGRITSVIVDPAARGHGLGRGLMRAAEDALAAAGCGLVEVTSHARRTDAHEFYRHLAYEQTSYRFARVFGEPRGTGGPVIS
jgi:GNAT superfamily N-acetyltransferase